MIKVTAILPSGLQQTLDLQILQFPGGELHPTIDPTVKHVQSLELKMHLRNPGSIMLMLLLTDSIRRAYPGKPITLALPYVPYARQDRVANPGEALGARVMCGLINDQGYQQVVIQDPHSDVVSSLLDRVVIEDPLESLKLVVQMCKPLALVSPDAGARKRVQKLAQQFDLPVVTADKVRDTRTGEITGTVINSYVPPGPLLVVDDICDGGRTFIELAKALREECQIEYDEDIPFYLYVTHGIFSKGLDPLLEHYAKVFTRNNWTTDDRCVTV